LIPEVADIEILLPFLLPSHGHNLGFIFEYLHIETYGLIAKQRLGKHVPAEANQCKNKMSIARQRISKHTFLIIEAVFSVWSVQSDYKEVFGCTEQYRREESREESSFGTPACQVMSLGAEELN
jgi:hypothetical protein